MEREKLRYSVGKKNFFVKLAALLMAFSALFRLLGYWGFWTKYQSGFIYTQIVLPVVCCLLFAIIILYLGRKLFWLTSLPVLLGTVFFILRALTAYSNVLGVVLSIIASVVIAMIYIGTVFGAIRTKWVLPIVFALPFAYHIVFVDLNTFRANEKAMSLEQWLVEVSILCVLLAMFLIPFAMKKRDYSKKDEAAEQAEDIEILKLNESEKKEDKPEDKGEPVAAIAEKAGDAHEQADGKTE